MEEEHDDFMTNTTLDNTSLCGVDGYLFKMRSYKPWVFHTGAVNTIIIIIFNCMVVRAFRQKGLLSSSTVPLIILAICDMLASLFMLWPNEIGFVFDFFYFDDRKETDIFLQIGKVKYPFCIFSEISYFLGHVFHSSSLLITSLVAVQKALAIQFPFWSKVNLKNRKISLICGLFLIFMAFCLNISLVLYTVYPSSDLHWCCRVRNTIKSWNASGHKGILLFCYMLCFILLISSSLFIAFSLTCRRRKKNDNKITRKRHHRSAIIVVAVACFCLITEIIPFSCRSSASLKTLCSNDIHQFELLILQFGFATNFLIYIIMSEKLRSRIIFCFKEKNESQVQLRSQMSSWISLTQTRCSHATS